MHTGEEIGREKETIEVCMYRSQWEHHALLNGYGH